MHDPQSPQALSQLIGSIYDCTLDPGLWPRALAGIAAALEAESVILSLNDLRRDRMVIDRSVGWEPSWLDERRRHLPEIHARLGEWFAAAPSIDDPFIASRHLPASYLHTSPYVRDCLAPLGIADITHFFLMHSPSHFSEMVVAHRGRAIADRALDLGRLLLPHLRRAVTISNLLDASLLEADRMAEALDAAACGVILTDARGAILHANRAGERLMAQGSLLRDGGGLVRAPTAAATRELHAAIALAAGGETQLGAAGLAVPLGGPAEAEDCPESAAGGGPLIAHVLPMAGGSVRPRLRGGAVAAIFVAAEPDARLEAGTLAAACGLTPAETRLLARLLAGQSLAAAAAALGIAPTTARSHLDSIFRKTGTSRQAELARLAARLAPPARIDSA